MNGFTVNVTDILYLRRYKSRRVYQRGILITTSIDARNFILLIVPRRYFCGGSFVLCLGD